MERTLHSIEMSRRGLILALLTLGGSLSGSASQDDSQGPDGRWISYLWHRSADWQEAEFELRCIGNPPFFRLRLVPIEDAKPWGASSDDYRGSVHLGDSPARAVRWDRYGDTELATRILDSEVAAYRQLGEIELIVELSEGRTFRMHSAQSSEVEDHVSQFLASCAEMPKDVDRQFTVDGIDVDLAIDVSERDIDDIRALASEFGINDIESISVEYFGMFGQPVAIVTSRAVLNTDEILESELMLKNDGWPESYIDPDDDEGIVVRGAWSTSHNYFRELDRWIVRDGDFSIEVRLGPDVSYDAAERIIRAVHRETLRDAQLDHLPDRVIESLSLSAPAPPRAEELGRWDGWRPRIERDVPEVGSVPASRDESSERYRLVLARGLTVIVRLGDDAVELLGSSRVVY